MRLVPAALAALLAVLAAAALAGAPGGPGVPDASTPASAPSFGSHADLRQQVRELLLARPCKECHLGYLKTAVPKALKVFDLAREDWPSTMADGQFEGLRKRLSSGMSPTRGPEGHVYFDAGTSDLDTVDRFIAAELAARAEAKRR